MFDAALHRINPHQGHIVRDSAYDVSASGVKLIAVRVESRVRGEELKPARRWGKKSGVWRDKACWKFTFTNRRADRMTLPEQKLRLEGRRRESFNMQCSGTSEPVRSCTLRRALGALLICSALMCVAAPAARAASGALWIADADNAQVVEYLPSQLKQSQTPIPLTVPIGAGPEGVCFDKSNNLWVVDDSEQILKFTASELKKLPTAPSPKVTIGSSSFSEINGCAFDKHGNLWTVDENNEALYEISAKQLKTSDPNITPAVTITDSAELQMTGARPGFVTFDKSGNLWTDGRDDDELFEFSASQLKSSGDKAAAIVLGGGGSFSDPGQIGFDRHGNLWVTSYNHGTVVMFSKPHIKTSNDDAPDVTISGPTLDGPWGLAFHGKDLWVQDYSDENAQEFLPGQIKISGSPAPNVLLTGAANTGSWGITFGPAFGKLL